MRPTTWRRLGQGDYSNTPDNFGWVNLFDSREVDWERTYVFKDEVVASMPYGHHQIGVFA